jgi:hypothetical protein
MMVPAIDFLLDFSGDLIIFNHGPHANTLDVKVSN